MDQLRLLITALLVFCLFCIGFTFYAATNFAIGAPSVKYEGGRFYLHKDGERLEKYYNQDYTAKAAAVNLSFECGCAITIEQPDIVVTTDGVNTIKLTWSHPTERVDGTELLEDEISHYLLEVNGEEIKTRAATVLKDGSTSSFTDYEVINIKDGQQQ